MNHFDDDCRLGWCRGMDAVGEVGEKCVEFGSSRVVTFRVSL